MGVVNRRRFLKGTGAVALTGIAGCTGTDAGDGGSTGDGGGGGDDLTTVTTVLPEGDIYHVYGQAVVDEGVYEEEGIDLDIQFRPFPAQVSSLVGGDVDVGLYSFVPYISHFNRGEDLVLFGWAGGLQGIHGAYSRSESGYEGFGDVGDGTVGVWSWGSSTVQSFQAVVAEQAGLDLRNDFETTTAEPPALVGLLDDGEIDVAIQIASFSIALQAQPDTYNRLAQINEMWLEMSGYPLAMTAWFARPGWYEENPDVAAGLIRASQSATDYWRANTRDILEEYGEIAGIEEEEEIEVVTGWADDGQVFAGEVDQGFVDAEWEYLELMQQHGFLEEVPSRDDLIKDPFE